MQQVPDASFDFVAKNQDLVRGLPLWAGGLGLVGILANRALSGVCIACLVINCSSLCTAFVIL
jgi:hypothetical protein